MRRSAGCRCRKPGTELFERAAADLGLRLPWCAMIGDRGLDAEAEHRLGMRTVLVPPPGLGVGARAFAPTDRREAAGCGGDLDARRFALLLSMG